MLATRSSPPLLAPDPLLPGAPGWARARRRTAVLLLAAAAVAVVALLSLAVGSRATAPADVVRVLLHPDGSPEAVVVRELRLPRTVLGLVVGGALGVVGAQLQGLTRNPLADPGLLGVSSGASLAVVAAGGVLGLGEGAGQVWAGLVGALGATAAVQVLAGTRRTGPLTLVLAGVALTAVLTAATTCLVLLDRDALEQYRLWTVGQLAGRELALLGPVLPPLVLGLLLAVAGRRTLDLLALGDDLARGLGGRLALGQAAAVLSATLLAASAVALAGPLVFVGLVAPHLARRAVGPAHGWLLPLSALVGAGLLLAGDVLGRVVAPPGEVPAGVVTALVGAPFLIALARRPRARG